MNTDTGEVREMSLEEAKKRLTMGENIVSLYDRAGKIREALAELEAAGKEPVIVVPGASRAERRKNARSMFGCSIRRAHQMGMV